MVSRPSLPSSVSAKCSTWASFFIQDRTCETCGMSWTVWWSPVPWSPSTSSESLKIKEGKPHLILDFSGVRPWVKSWRQSSYFVYWGRWKWSIAFQRSRLCSTVLWSLSKMCSTFSSSTSFSFSSLPWWVSSSSTASSSTATTSPSTTPRSASKLIALTCLSLSENNTHSIEMRNRRGG